MTEFKKDDWIIATKPIMRMESTGMGFSFSGPIRIPDEKYMRRPVRILAVTEQHLVVTWPSRLGLSGKDPKDILPISEANDRGMIIAAPELVEIAGEL